MHSATLYVLPACCTSRTWLPKGRLITFVTLCHKWRMFSWRLKKTTEMSWSRSYSWIKGRLRQHILVKEHNKSLSIISDLSITKLIRSSIVSLVNWKTNYTPREISWWERNIAQNYMHIKENVRIYVIHVRSYKLH